MAPANQTSVPVPPSVPAGVQPPTACAHCRATLRQLDDAEANQHAHLRACYSLRSNWMTCTLLQYASWAANMQHLAARSMQQLPTGWADCASCDQGHAGQQLADR